KVVNFYAPVFPNVEYKLAKPIENYASQFEKSIPQEAGDLTFSCNCILNFLYGELEGKQINVNGPMTFGEIAYQLLNQTMVYVTLDK
ncbi:MAG: hypothetical protein KDD50_09505, partial [Bdellovibrionales bacterium]|nr:hypothetical protein [Bdellovibrionales bacterium]